MLAYRVIARLDIKGPNLIKPLQFEGLRVLGKPQDFAKKYAEDGADELLYIDTVATLYGRNQLNEILEDTTREVFIPLTAGGGIRSDGDINSILAAGADKIAINSAALARPDLISRLAERSGSQCIVVSIEAKKTNGGWEAYSDCGRIRSGKSVCRWACEVSEKGAGEIIVTSIDKDGMRKGPDFELLKEIKNLDLPIPVIYSGGVRLEDVEEVAEYSDGMAIGASLHYGDCTIKEVKDKLRSTKEIR